MVYKVQKGRNYLTNSIMQMHKEGECKLVFSSANTFTILPEYLVRVVNDTFLEITNKKHTILGLFFLDSIIGVIKWAILK